MTKSQLAGATLAGAYLMIVLGGAEKVRLAPLDTRAGEVAGALLFCCGADNSYGFFAPRVPNELSLEFEYTTAAGRTWRENVHDPFGHEARHRVNTTLAVFGHCRDAEVRRAMVASWAAWALGRNPEADAVRVSVKYRTMPTMREFNGGASPEWNEWVRATYRRDRANGPPSADGITSTRGPTVAGDTSPPLSQGD